MANCTIGQLERRKQFASALAASCGPGQAIDRAIAATGAGPDPVNAGNTEALPEARRCPGQVTIGRVGPACRAALIGHQDRIGKGLHRLAGQHGRAGRLVLIDPLAHAAPGRFAGGNGVEHQKADRRQARKQDKALPAVMASGEQGRQRSQHDDEDADPESDAAKRLRPEGFTLSGLLGGGIMGGQFSHGRLQHESESSGYRLLARSVLCATA